MSLPASDRTKKADNRTTMELGAVLPETAEVKDDHLFVGGVDMVDLAREQGTALYVIDEADLRHRMESYVSSFRSRYENSDVIYASKAFLNKEVARIANQEGLCLDVSGGGELACALAAGFPADRVFVHGNNKTPQELREAISAGVGRIVVDSRIELGRVSRIAGELGVTQDIYLRITPGVEADTHEYIKTGCEDSKFGFTMLDDFAFRCVEDALAAPNVRLAGLHCHIGSQVFALHSFREAADVMVSFMARIRDQYGCAIEELDLGGGLGIAYLADDAPSSIDEFAECTTTAVKESCEKYGLDLPRLLVEPGRSLVANAGITLYTVGILKTLPNIRKYVAVDGGMSDNIRTALYHADYEPTIANKAGQARTEIVTLCGKHCESGDAVVIDMPLQTPELGDIVAVFGTGAYCYSMSSNYNGQPRPAIVFVRDGQARVTTRRETYEDLYARDL
ncbi:diaminopimelate decarboxylase [Xiamenia xianingshaonis]|uniref:Diaminopimelate decarboxylase n=1 Tax=Xiamenia xianingshaonis TaxID=2682776 RepID=A0A9E6MQR4_9ACTN|nr:diaminopimelate decarboxylase [Xiamenia xianingshaonis]NHM14965.1 diaminopimelate decarboxylase [Xiamenia xianingshaonis]NHM16857.1 diaminopimelate decarboxylase [Xiamenia xianingshaonis]QTU84016.1 diaminopimelate decarboxylase [Xiamenia xianingshaonis]